MQDVLKVGTVLGISNWLGGGGRGGGEVTKQAKEI